MIHRFATIILVLTLFTLPACERMDALKQRVQGGGQEQGAVNPTHLTISGNALKQLQGVLEQKMQLALDQKINERVNLEVKQQLAEQVRLIEQKIVPCPQAGHAENIPESSAAASSEKTAISDFRRGFSEVAALAIPAVVNVSTTQVVDQKALAAQEMPKMGPGFPPLEELFKDFFEPQDRPKRVQSVGSGFIVRVSDKEAFIVTNNHVVADASKITIILADRTEIDAVLHANDDRTDLAVLRVKLDSLPSEKRKLPTLSWGNSDEAKVGQFIVAIGNPFGLGSTVTSGIISGKGRDIVLRAKNNKSTDLVDDFIQHDASINMGNSGGVLLNTEGKVIGINTAIFSPSGGSIGIGFAIPANLAKSTIDQLIQFGHTQRGWLGVSVLPVSPEVAESLGLGETRGGIVKAINKGSPAEKIGLKENDIIIEFDGKKLSDKVRLSRVVSETPVGKTVTMKVLRDNNNEMSFKEMTFNVVVAEYPSNLTMDDAARQTIKAPPEKVTEVLGMGLVPMPKSIVNGQQNPGSAPGLPPLKNGVLVVDVKQNSSAEDSGLKKGDVINEINLKPVTKPEEIGAAIKEIHETDPKRPSVLLTVTRRGLPPQYVALSFKSLAETAAENAKKVPETPGTMAQTPQNPPSNPPMPEEESSSQPPYTLEEKKPEEEKAAPKKTEPAQPQASKAGEKPKTPEKPQKNPQKK